jgi:nucleoside-diphosphate-sugar epimerase
MKELVIVTGGSGFIGTNLINRLLSLGYKVINLDIKKPKNKDHNNIYQCLDITNKKNVKNFLKNWKPDYLIHLAARTDLLGKSIAEYEINYKGVENICVGASNTQSLKKILFASSMLVCKVGHIPVMDSEYSADTPYGKSKVEGELIVKKYAKKLPIHFVFRPTSIWGPWFQSPYRDFFDILLAGRYVKIGSRSCTKTYGYVENSVNQIISLMECCFETESEIPIYIGDKEPLNVDNWADQITATAGLRKPPTMPYIAIKMGGFLGDLLSKLNIKFPLTSFRIKNMTTNNIILKMPIEQINKYPVISIEEGILSTLDWMNSAD